MGLNLDRVGASRYLISVRRDEDIVNWVKSNTLDGFAPGKDPAIRDKIAELWIEAQVCRLMTMRSMSIVERGPTVTCNHTYVSKLHADAEVVRLVALLR